MTPTEEMLTAALGITWGGLGLSFAIGKWVHGREHSDEMPLYRIGQLEKRMDQAGQKMSDLADELQKLPDKFVARRECEHIHKRDGA